ncbi:hypothetical protein ACFQZZ_25320 [Nocardia sp. GCM10030253]
MIDKSLLPARAEADDHRAATGAERIQAIEALSAQPLVGLER